MGRTLAVLAAIALEGSDMTIAYSLMRSDL